MDANWWEHILNCSCVLEWMEKKKPFGNRLPTEVQSRILCMVWEAEHKDKWCKVMEELIKIEVCELSEWCCTVSPRRGYRTPMHDRRFLFSPNSQQNRVQSNKCFETCRWCLLYYGKRCALDVEILERTLTRKRQQLKEQEELRNGEPMISNTVWADFVRNNIQRYHDTYQFSLTQVMIPMLGFIEPCHLQFNHTRVHALTFTTISTGAEMALDNFQKRVGRFTLYHPRYLVARYREKQQQQRAKILLAERLKETLKEKGLM